MWRTGLDYYYCTLLERKAAVVSPEHTVQEVPYDPEAR